MNTDINIINGLDIDDFLKIVDKESSEKLLKLDSRKIKQIKNDLFQRLNFKPKLIKELHSKLEDYRFVDDLKDLEYGKYIRWINMNKYEEIKLTKGGIVCYAKAYDDSGTILMCKNKFNHIFSIKMEECLIFQKLSDQEKVLLSAMTYLNN
jgi:hypothetical protein